MIINAIKRAYQLLSERNWDTIYWAIDLHGVCLKSNYKTGIHEFISREAITGLKTISDRPESKIILWSGCHPEEQAKIVALFAEHGIKVSYFNENPDEKSTATGDFSSKFYFSVLLDDKAGFDPARDWAQIIDYLRGKECHK